MSIRRFLKQTRLLLEEGLYESRKAFSNQDTHALRPMEMVALEERILMSASPLAAVAESPFASAAQGGLTDQQLLDVAADSVLPQSESTVLAAGVSADNASPPEGITYGSDTPTEQSLELVFIDAGVSNLDQMIADLQSEDAGDETRTLELIVLDSDRNGLAQITATLLNYDSIDGIHIVSHGSAGQVHLGSLTLSLDNIDTYRSAFTAWQHSLSENADLLFYGCHLAASDDGRELMNQISAACDCDVAASDDLTGHEELGGDWELEYQVGQIEAAIAFSQTLQTSWFDVLGATTFQEGVSGYAETQDTYIDQGATGTSFGTLTEVNTDVDDGAGDATKHGLIRFDGIIGVDPGDIPQSVQITSASLTVETANASGDTVSIYEMQQSWSESSTWADFGGLTPGGELAASPLNSVIGPSGTVTFTGLESSVQKWIDGATNYGWGLLLSNDDGWNFDSSEGTTAPILSVSYITPGSQASTAHTLTVDTTNDVLDGDTSSIDALLASRGADGFISLREAIWAANNTANFDASTPDVINFAIGALGSQQTITLADGLPALTDPVYLDGMSQGGGGYSGNPLIHIDASSTANFTTSGITVWTSDSTVRGFVVTGSTDEGIEVAGSSGHGPADNNVIENNWVGIDFSGAAAANADRGILVVNDASNNIVRNNVVAGNVGVGIEVRGASVDGNIVENNIIGLAANGTTIVANVGHGVRVAEGATNTRIGTDGNGVNDANEGNVISGNGGSGIWIDVADSTTINGNLIGVDQSDLVDKGNTGNGITIALAATNTTIGQAGFGNVISGNFGHGIDLLDGSNTTIQGNTIGGNAANTVALRNNLSGINIASIQAASNIQVGGLSAGEGNLIVNNFERGIMTSGAGSGDQILGNTITNSGYSGIVSARTGGMEIIGNVVYDNGTRAAFDEVSVGADHVVYHNTIHGAKDDGISVEGASVVLHNNIVTGSAGYGVRIDGGSLASESHNLITDAVTGPANLSGQAFGFTPDASDLNADPLFTNSAGGDFRLMTASTAIDAGVDLGVNQPDVNGAGVGNFNSSAPDMGALEYLNLAPVAHAGGPYTITEGSNLTLDSSMSSDGNSDSLTYNWDLDNDSFYDDLTTISDSPTVAWATLAGLGLNDNGVYTIGLEVSDGSLTDTTTATLTIDNATPTITVTGAATVVTGTIYTINLSATDPGNDTLIGWTINWGDGTITTEAGAATSASHTYAGNTNAGLTHNITVSATDEDGTFTDSNSLTSSFANNSVYLLDGNTGLVEQTIASGTVNQAGGAVVGPNGNFFVSDGSNSSVLEYNGSTGSLIGTFVAAGSGGLSQPYGMTFGPDGNLYVGSYGTNEIFRYNGTTGAFIDVFVTSGGNGPTGPMEVRFGPDGNLYVSNWFGGTVKRFDGTTGAYVDDFVTAGTSATGFDWRNGRLYVGDGSLSRIHVFDATTGAAITDFAIGSAPRGLSFGPDDLLYIAQWSGDTIIKYDVDTQTSAGTFSTNATSGIDGPWNIAFTPDHQVQLLANTPPTFTAFAGIIDTTNEDTEVEITLAELKAQGDEADGDGTVDSFVVKSVATGTLKIGTSAGTATAWAAGSNDTIDATNHAYWTPATDANGTLNAFAVVAEDNNGAESVTNVTAQVSVTAVNDAPVVDLNGTNDSGTNYAFSYTENDPATNVTDTDAIISDVDHSTYNSITITLSGFVDANQEKINVAGRQFSATNATTQTAVVGVTTFNIAFTGSVFTITNDGGGTMPETDLQDVLRSVQYFSNDGNPTNGIRTFQFSVQDAAGLDSVAVASSSVNVGAVNDPPTLTAFAAAVDTTNEDTEVEITFAELVAQGDEADVDGTVTSFVVKSVATGTLKIGTSAGTATTWAAGSNDTIDATNHAYWTPAVDANGTLNAFAVVAKDNLNAESAPNVQVQVDVTDVNDVPTLTAFAFPVDTTSEDTEIELTFAELTAQGDEADSDGTVDAFVVKSVTSGTLRIGTSAGTATAFAAGTNDAIDATNKAYWTPVNNANGTQNAFQVVAQDDDGGESAGNVTVQVSVTAVNDAPTLTTFAAPVDTTSEDTELEVTFAELAAQGDEADVDGTVTAFIVKSVATGTLKIGTNAGTATVWAAGSNDTIDATNHAYWTPATDANGILNAFAVVAEDNNGAESVTNVTAQVSVTAVNDNPTGSGSLTTTSLNDNAGATALFGGLTVDDVDAGENDLAVMITLSDPTAGTVSSGGFTETAVGSGVYVSTGHTAASANTALDNVTFTPTNNSGPSGTFNTDISVTVHDQGSGGEQTVLSPTTVTITRINDVPVLTAGATLSWNEGDGPLAIDGTITVADADDTLIESAVVQITGNLDTGNDVLSATLGGGISGSTWIPSTGTLTLTGPATLAQYQSTLRAVTFHNTSPTPSTLDRTITWTVNDGDGNSIGVTSTVQVGAVNNAPVLGNNALTMLEGGTVTLSAAELNATDADNADSSLMFSVSGVTGGRFELVSAPQTAITSFSQAQITANQVVFVHDGSESAPTYSITVSDGSTNVGPAAATVSFTNVNDVPILTAIGGDSVTIFNDGTPVTIDTGAAAALQDSDSPANYDGGYLQFSGSSFDAADSLGLRTTGTISLSTGFNSGSVVSISGLNVGSLTGVSSSAARINLNGNATAAHVNTLLNEITFVTTSSTLGGRTVDISFNDGDGTANGGNDTSNIESVNIFVAQAGNGLVTTNEDTTYTFVATDFDFTGLTGSDLQQIEILALPANGTLVYNGGNATVGQIVTKADIDSGLLQFAPVANENGASYASFDFRINNGKSVINVLAGEPNSHTLNGGALRDTDAILADSANFGASGTYPSYISVGATSSTIDAGYLAQGSILFNGFVQDSNWTGSELTALDTWVNAGGVLISNSDLNSYDAVSDFYGLTIGGTGNATWHVADDTSAIMNGPFGLVGNNNDPFNATGAISYFNSASLAVGDQILATDSVSGEPTIVLRSVGSGWILFTSDEGIFRANMTGGGAISTANDILAANIFAWAADQAPATSSHTIGIDVTAVNDDPTNSGGFPANITVDEDVPTAVDLSSLNVQDIDSATGNLTMTLTTSGGGTLSAIGAGGVSVGGTGTNVLTLTGNSTDLNTFLNNATAVNFTGALNTNGTSADSIQVDITDNGNVGSGGGGTINFGTINVDITAVNDAPANTVPGTQTIVEETLTAITGLSIADVDAASGTMTTRLQVSAGVLNVTLSGTATISSGTNGTADLTISGTVADINGTLASLTYQPNTNVTGTAADTLTMTTDDGGNTGGAALQDIDSVQIDVTNVNDEEVLAANNLLIVNEGDVGSVIGQTLLETTDVDNTASQLVYTLITPPTSGTLRLGGSALIAGNTFSQLDINSGLLTYDHNDSEVFVDSFDFRVDDGAGTFTSATFNIQIDPVNDNDPTFTSGTSFNVAENGTGVTTVTASDADLPTQTLTFSIAGGTDPGRFNIVGGSGVLTFATAPDFEAPADANGDNVYEVIVEVNDGLGRASQQTISVTVTDVDEFDVTPIIDNNAVADQIDENVAIGTDVGITAFSEDLDGTNNGVTYSLDDDAGGLFTIDSATGIVTTNAAIDYESTGGALNITVRATSEDLSTTTRSFAITVNDVDEFDVTPIVDSNAAADNIDENVPSGTVVGITAFSEDFDATNNVVSYSLDNDAGGLFTIDSVTGVVTTNAAIDYESVGNSLNIVARATSGDGSTTTQAYTITINDLDEFDVTPIVDNDTAPDQINENVGIGTAVGITAFSEDLDGTNNAITYSLDDDAGGLFAIDSITGAISTNAAIDYETVGSSLNIVARATSADGSSTTQAYTININDLNDTPPVVTPGQTFSVSEFASVGTSVGTVGATDADTIGTLGGWSILAGNSDGIFAINSVTGEITIVDTTHLNYESTPVYTLTLTVSDGVTTSAPETIVIALTDENDTPVFTPSAFSIDENANNGSVAGTILAHDEDGSDVLTYSISGPTGQPFVVNSSTGVITVADVTQLDFETTTGFSITVVATDSGGLVDSQVVAISLNNLNEAPIDLTLSGTFVNENSVTGTLVGSVTGSDADAGDVLSYLLINDAGGRFSVDSVTGAITVANGTLLNFEAASLHGIIVRTTDSGGLTYDESFTITVNDVNEAPVAGNDSFTGRQLETLVVPAGLLTGNDFDIDGDSTSVVLAGGPANGSIVLNANGSFAYTPHDNFAGTDRFTYYVTDGSLNSNLATVEIEVAITLSGPAGNGGNSGPNSGGDDNSNDSTPDEESSSKGQASDNNKLTNEAILIASANRAETPIQGDDVANGASVKPSSQELLRKTSSEMFVAVFLDEIPESELADGFSRTGRSSESGTTVRVGSSSEYLFAQVTVDHPFFESRFFESNTHQFVAAAKEEAFREKLFEKVIVGSTAAVSTSVSVGYVVWMLRGGSLLTTFLSSLPAWQSFDPLPVLESFEEEDTGDGETLASIVNGSTK